MPSIIKSKNYKILIDHCKLSSLIQDSQIKDEEIEEILSYFPDNTLTS
jgi:hypothetical protein